MRRTRVLLMATSMRGGGSEHQVVLLARHLPRDRFDVHLYLTQRTGELLGQLPSDVKVHSPQEHQIAGQAFVQKLVDRWPGTLLRRHSLALASVVREHQIDVIYDRAFHNTMIAGHRSIRDSERARRVSTLVSPPHLALPMVEKRFVEAKRRLLSRAYRHSDTVITVSDAVADSAAEYYGLVRDRIVVIANPIEIDAVRASVAEMPRPVRRDEDGQRSRFHFVCVGRMTREKGQADLIAAIARLPGRLPESSPRITVRFVGDGPDREELQRQWAALSGDAGEIDGHRVEFAGIVTPATCEIAFSDALVLPSHFEGMPNVVLEAFVLETPVIATRSGGTAELQRFRDDPTCFWAEPQSPESLAGAMVAMLGDPVQRAQHVTAGTQWVETRHTIDAAMSRLTPILLG